MTHDATDSADDHDRPMTAPPEFTAPGPGVWQRDTDHQAATRSPLLVALFTDAFGEGTRAAFARYGLPLDRLQGADVHGWFYYRAVPAGVPDRGGPPPPLPVLRLLTRLVPELRRRERTARGAIAERRWVADAQAWAAERTGWTDRIEGLLSPDLSTAPDAELAALARAASELGAGLAHRHFGLMGLVIGVGRLLAEAPRLGLTADDVTALLRGGAPETAGSGAPLAELAAIAADLGGVPDTLSGLRSMSPRAAGLVDDYLRVYGWRPLGNDPECVTLAEVPDQLVELVRAADARRTADDGRLPLIRERVPADRRAVFDALLADARECYGAADDNAAVLGWAMGALRRVALEVGRRAATRGELDDVQDVFLLTPTELVTTAAGTTPVPVEQVRDRRAARRAADLEDAPLLLGGTEIPSPPAATAFPPAMATLTEAVGTYLAMKLSPPAATPATRSTLTVGAQAVARGTGVVAGSVTGRIVVCATPDDALERIEPGDILVCPYTSASWNSLFPMLGGIVTRFGGPLGHTGVMAREFGIPAMVGIAELPHGADGATGTLTVET